MNAVKNYDIAFNGLSAGIHQYEFDIDDSFFEAFEGSEIKKGNARADVELTKASGVLTLDFDIKGTATVECDRCLDDCEMPVDYQGRLTVKFSETEMDEDDRYDGDILWINPNDGVVNVAQYIYESIALSLPYQRVHPADVDGKPTCNPDMLARFRIISEKEFDEIAAASETQKLEDNPESEKLKELKEKLK